MEEKRRKAVAKAHRTRRMNLKWHKREGDPRTPDKVYYAFKNRLQEILGKELNSAFRTRLQFFLSYARTKFPQRLWKIFPEKPSVLGSNKLEFFLQKIEEYVRENKDRGPRYFTPGTKTLMKWYREAKKVKPKELWI